MATYTQTKILEGLIDHLYDLGLDEPIAWPNVNFAPTAGTAYLRAFLLPAETNVVTMGSSGKNRHTGLFQVSVFWPDGDGAVDASEVVGEIIAGFKVGTSITRETQIIRVIRPPYRNPAVQESGWYSIPVRIPYQADAANPS